MRSFIFVLIFSFRNLVKKIGKTYLEKVGSGKECIPVRHVLALKNIPELNDRDPKVSSQHGKVLN